MFLFFLLYYPTIYYFPDDMNKKQLDGPALLPNRSLPVEEEKSLCGRIAAQLGVGGFAMKYVSYLFYLSITA